MPAHMLHQQSPFLHRHGNNSTPAAPSRVKVSHTTASGKATCTSTPNTAGQFLKVFSFEFALNVMTVNVFLSSLLFLSLSLSLSFSLSRAALKRQLVASPFASPVLKQPCTKRLDILEEDSTHAPPPNHRHHHPPSHNHRDIPNNESDSKSSIPQPVSLADLGTETYELTSITPTTCTSDFAQFGLDDPTENATRAENDRPHPLHSTAAGHMTMMSSIPAHWNPPIHSTMMVDSHCCKVQGSNNLSTNKPIPQVSLPLVGGLSRIQSHSHSTANSTNDSRLQPAIVGDSGVAASGEFNFNNTAAATMASMALHGGSSKVGESGIAVSGSDPVLKVAKTEERGQNLVGGGGGAKVDGNLSRDALLASKLRPDGINGPALMAIREGNFESKGGTKGKRGAESREDKLKRAAAHCHSEVDSGLVFSPEHNLLEHIPEEQPAVLFHDQRTVPMSERTKFHPLSPSMSNEFASDKFNVRHQNTPSRHSNLQPSTGFVVPMSPASYHHHHHHHGMKGGGAPGMINNGLGGSHYPAFSSSRLTSKCTGLSSGAVLPSRIKLSSANAITAGLKSPSYMYSSYVPHHTNYRGKENGAPLSSLGSPDVFGVGGASSKTTPTSRYSSKGALKSLSGKSNLSDEMDEVIRKKEIVKAHLQFTSKFVSNSIPSWVALFLSTVSSCSTLPVCMP